MFFLMAVCDYFILLGTHGQLEAPTYLSKQVGNTDRTKQLTEINKLRKHIYDKWFNDN